MIDDRLHHLLDRMRRGALLPEEREQLATAVTMLLARLADQDGAADIAVSAVRLMNEAGAQRDAAETRAAVLEAEVARLAAGQCTHTRRMCDLHHTTPVDGCPYPKCVKAREQQGPPVHLAKGTNAEDCPSCKGTNPDYPFLCPGPGQPANDTASAAS